MALAVYYGSFALGSQICNLREYRESIAMCTLEFMLLLLSAVTSSLNTSDLIPLVASSSRFHLSKYLFHNCAGSFSDTV